MKQLLSAWFGGLIFAIGLGLSGMTDANKVIGFLNLAGDWDPSLAFVMIGAIGVHLGFYKWVLKRETPLFSAQFHIPTRQDVDPKLLGGAALFGVGWGMGGFCPGPGLVSSAGLGTSALVFTGSMLLGMVLHGGLKHLLEPKEQEGKSTC
jgi:hypothetical protein